MKMYPKGSKDPVNVSLDQKQTLLKAGWTCKKVVAQEKTPDKKDNGKKDAVIKSDKKASSDKA